MYEQWVAMEQFYNNHFAWGLVLVVVLAIFSLSSIYYIKQLIPKIILIVTLVAVIAFGVVTVRGYDKYGDLISRTGNETATVRDFKRSFFMIDMGYPAMEKKAYRDGYFDDAFEALGFYEEVEVSEPVEFMGETQHGAFVIQINERNYLVTNSWVTFSDEVAEPMRVGKQYQVMDERFVDLGYVEQSRVLLEGYVVPSEYEGQEVDPEIENSASFPRGEILNGWAVP